MILITECRIYKVVEERIWNKRDILKEIFVDFNSMHLKQSS